jgi:hypothetical protein
VVEADFRPARKAQRLREAGVADPFGNRVELLETFFVISCTRAAAERVSRLKGERT